VQYGTRTLIILTTLVAAFFGGRATLSPGLRQAEETITKLQVQVDRLGQALQQCETDRSSRPPKP
jgi:hypothetical protein